MTEQRAGVEKNTVCATGRATRDASFELLRCVAMCMIIVVHYLSKGNVLVNLPTSAAGGMNGAAIGAWIVEAICLPAVNVYIMISGYFGAKSSFKVSKLARLWGTVIFYSVAITLVLGLSGNLANAQGSVDMASFTIYDWMNVVFPVVTEQYWFITAYVMLYLFMPFLSAGVEKLDQKSFRNVLIVLFGIFSLSKSVLPMDLPTDGKGYDVLWLICLYLLGGYFGRFGCRILEKRMWATVCCLGSAMAMFAMAFVARAVYLRTGILGDFVLRNSFYNCNQIFCLTSAVGLFWMFKGLPIRSGRLSAFICKVSGCTMAVYLIHEQLYMRYAWPRWFGVQEQAGKWTFLPHLLLTVTCVFVVCVLIEMVRKAVTKTFVGLIKKRTKE